MKNILVIPFYKNEHYIDNFVKYFTDFPDEYDLFQKICIFNDSPESPGSEHLAERCAFAKFEYIKNEKNLGFLKTVNRGFAIAKDFDANLVVLNSDTLPYKNSFYELLRCFEIDSMLGCVAPRSNNATICNLFAAPVYIDGQDDLVDVCKIFEESKKYVPEVSYAPVTNGFCIAIRSSVLKAFQGYSDEFDPGYEEENDYCLRVATHGFRIGISNHSFVAHLEGKSFGLNHGRDELKRKNHQLLLAKYPGYYGLLKMHDSEFESKAYKKILSALQQGKNWILVDASNLGAYHNGTNKLIVECVKAMAILNYKIALIANKVAFEFHGLDAIPEIELIEGNVYGYYFYGFRVGQPFDHGSLVRVPAYALFTVNIFFDTIAIDCPQIYFENPEIYGIWSAIDRLYEQISFISKHSKDQYQLRFLSAALPGMYANLLPRVFEANQVSSDVSSPSKKYALVVGNKFTHKGVEAALRELPKLIGIEYVVLCEDINLLKIRSDIRLMPVGEISQGEMDMLFSSCEFIVFPSFAEGYGFPLVEAITFNKRVFLRDVGCYREIICGLDTALLNLVCFVEDFSQVKIDENRQLNEVKDLPSESYHKYIEKIISQFSINFQDKDIFKNLRSRIQFIELISYDKGAELFFIRIYRRLNNYSIFRPLLKILKKLIIKFKFYETNLINKL